MIIDITQIPTNPTFYTMLGTCVFSADTTALIEGYCQGYRDFMELHNGKALHGEKVYGFFMDTMIDATRPSLWNTGYILGWTAGLYGSEPAPIPTAEPVFS